MKLINIPIEPLEERYSVQWDKWFAEAFVDFDVEFNKEKKEISFLIPVVNWSTSVHDLGSFIVYTNAPFSLSYSFSPLLTAVTKIVTLS